MTLPAPELVEKVEQAIADAEWPEEAPVAIENYHKRAAQAVIPIIESALLQYMKERERLYATLDAGHMAIDGFLDMIARERGLLEGE